MNPSERLVAELRAAAHDDVDRLYDQWPTIMENRRTRTNPTDESGRPRKSTGSHSDPTGDAASTTTPAMKWLDDVKKHFREGQSLVARAEGIVGRPACAGCGQDIGIRPSRRLRSKLYHFDGCHQRAAREMSARRSA